ncbi:MAG: DUF2339 domain-containing protein, partial [Vicinamibacterales bacterium]
MMPVIFGLLGALLGAVYGALGTAALGLALGLLWNRLGDLSEQVTALRKKHAGLRARQRTLEREIRTLKRQPAAAAAQAPALPTRREAPPPHREEPVSRPSPVPLPLPPTPHVEQPALPPADRAAGPPEGIDRLIEFFTTGNVVAKAGMVVVFFGVAFLVRYAADRGLLPIEYRLTATVAGALVLLGVGWRLRHSQPEYAMVLQGGAVGLLYLTIFAAFRLYELLPAALTFALLIVVVVVSGLLAVLQNAMPLAVLGTSGGFLAPILASTGGGSHVGLFSYYAVLNAGVLGIAWFRAWRFLNWLAFVFTFGIGFVWGRQYYQPELFATTGPFLAGFFLLFVAVAVLFAHRQPPQLRGYVDGSLVFGAPAIAFGMQSVLVRDIPFGRAYSAVIASALYLG